MPTVVSDGGKERESESESERERETERWRSQDAYDAVYTGPHISSQ